MKKNVTIIFSLAVLLLLPSVALAVDPLTWVLGIVNRFLDIIVWPVFLSVSVVMFMWAGFLFLTAQGDPGKNATARKLIIWAVVGIVVAVFAFSIVGILEQIIAPSSSSSGGSSPPSTSPSS